MQIWKKINSGQIERLENADKHPEKIEWLQNNNYMRVVSETDYSQWKAPSKVKKVAKKLVKKKKK
jgi:hypothetical protein|tara:strand:+ start:372 stop:566 length:195 start_codon:yes stop_codon:yes gene_type:complete